MLPGLLIHHTKKETCRPLKYSVNSIYLKCLNCNGLQIGANGGLSKLYRAISGFSGDLKSFVCVQYSIFRHLQVKQSCFCLFCWADAIYHLCNIYLFLRFSLCCEILVLCLIKFMTGNKKLLLTPFRLGSLPALTRIWPLTAFNPMLQTQS